MRKQTSIYLESSQLDLLKKIKKDFYKGTVSSLIRESVNLIIALYLEKQKNPDKITFKIVAGFGLLEETTKVEKGEENG